MRTANHLRGASFRNAPTALPGIDDQIGAYSDETGEITDNLESGWRYQKDLVQQSVRFLQPARAHSKARLGFASLSSCPFSYARRSAICAIRQRVGWRPSVPSNAGRRHVCQMRRPLPFLRLSCRLRVGSRLQAARQGTPDDAQAHRRNLRELAWAFDGSPKRPRRTKGNHMLILIKQR